MDSKLDSKLSTFHYENLFEFGEAVIHGAFRAQPEIIVDPFSLARAESLPSKPLVFRYHMGGLRRYDLIGTSLGIELFSDRVVQILRENSFTGWITYPIELYDKAGGVVSGYNGFAVTGRCGPIDWSLGKKVRKPPMISTSNPYDAWIGLYFDPRTWDGSDFFVPEDTMYKIITEPVVHALKKAKIGNTHFTRVTEFERTWREPCDDD